MSHSGQSKYFYIKSRLGSLVLEVANEAQHPGAPVQMWSRGDKEEDHQLWYYDVSSGTIRSKLNEFCMDIDYGENICMKPYEPDDPNQQWRVDALNDTVENASTHKVLHVEDSSTQEGATVKAAPYKEGNESQMWDFEFLPVKYFIIKTKSCSKVLDVKGWLEGQEAKAGSKVIIYSRKTPPEDNQIWYEDITGVIRCKLGDLALDSSDGKTMRVAIYNQYDPNHQWIRSGDRIINRFDPAKCLDIKKKSKKDEAELCPFEYRGQSNQKWEYEYIDV